MGFPAPYDKAKNALMEYKTAIEVKQYIDKVATLRELAKRAGDRELEQTAIEARLLAERRLGEMMAESRGAQGKIVEHLTGEF